MSVDEVSMYDFEMLRSKEADAPWPTGRFDTATTMIQIRRYAVGVLSNLKRKIQSLDFPGARSVLLGVKNHQRGPVLEILFFLLGTFLMVHQYILPFDGFTPLRGDYLEDSGNFTWVLWHVCESLCSGENPFITNRIYFPVGANLGTQLLMIGCFPLVLLIKILSFNSPYYPIYAFNIIVFLLFFCLSYFTYLFLRRIGFSKIVALIPAWSYGFCDFYYWHWKHLHLIAIGALPMLAYFGMRLWEKQTYTWVLVFSIVFGWSVYMTEFSVFFAIALILFGLFSFFFKSSRTELISRFRQLGFKKCAMMIVVFLFIVSPFLYFFVLSDSEVIPPDIRFFSSLSANAAGFFLPQKISTWLYGNLFESLSRQINKGLAGREVFLGFPFLLLLLTGLWGRKNVYYWISLAMGIVFCLLSLGPTFKFLSHDTGIWMPYGTLMKVPPFTQNRSPVRIAMIGFFFLTPFAALGLERVRLLLRTRFPNWISLLFLGVVFTWVVLEKYTPPPQPRWQYTADFEAIQKMRPGPVISLSMPSRACNEMVFQTFHGRPISNGASSRTTTEQRRHKSALSNALRRDIKSFVALIRKKGFENIIVDKRLPFVDIEYLRQLSDIQILEQTRHPRTAVKRLTGNTQTPIVISLPEGAEISGLEMLAQARDRFQLVFYNKDRAIRETSSTPNRESGSGYQWRFLDNPVRQKVDRIEILPYQIGNFRTVKAVVVTQQWAEPTLEKMINRIE